MATYKVKTTTELWTRTGNRTGIVLDTGTILETGANIIIKDRDCLVIIFGEYINKCVEKIAIEPATTETPTQEIMYSRPGDVIIVLRDAAGNVIQRSLNDTEIKWVRQP